MPGVSECYRRPRKLANIHCPVYSTVKCILPPLGPRELNSIDDASIILKCDCKPCRYIYFALRRRLSYCLIDRTSRNELISAIVACGVSLYLRRPTGRWKPRLLCDSHTGCLQAVSVLAWLAACWCAWGMCLCLSQGARKYSMAQTDASDYYNKIVQLNSTYQQHSTGFRPHSNRASHHTTTSVRLLSIENCLQWHKSLVSGLCHQQADQSGTPEQQKTARTYGVSSFNVVLIYASGRRLTDVPVLAPCVSCKIEFRHACRHR